MKFSSLKFIPALLLFNIFAPAKTEDLMQDFASKENAMSHYVLKDCFLFHIDIEPEAIADFHEDHHKQYMKHIPVVDDICLNDSIFVFHPYSTLYFIYYEEDKMAVKVLKSALKSGSHNTRITKRVHWNDKKKRNTRKHVVS